MVQGRRLNLTRHLQVIGLWAQKLSVTEIGRRLGISRQTVYAILNPRAPSACREVPCCRCGRKIVSAGLRPMDRQGVLCIPCLKQLPDAPFALRLTTYRLAKGLTRRQLADAAGTTHHTLRIFEIGQRQPPPRTIAALAEALGVTARALGLKGRVPRKNPRGRPLKGDRLG